MANFSSQEDDILINLVAQIPLLYDISLSDYKNSSKRDKAWEEIGKEVNKSGKTCKNRWKNIKDTFYRQKKKLKGSTGSATNPRSKFETYREQLSFLETIPQERTTFSNISECSIDRSDVVDNTGTLEIVDTLGPSGVTSASTIDAGETQGIATADTEESVNVTLEPSPRMSQSIQENTTRKKRDIITYLGKRDANRQRIEQSVSSNQDEEDEIDTFTKHANSVLKKLPSYYQIKAMQEIFEILTKYKMRTVEAPRFEGSPNSMTSARSDTFNE